jgi:hypothetical protein
MAQVTLVTSQLSAMTGLGTATEVLQLFNVLLLVVWAGQVIVGTWLSITTTIIEQLVMFPATSIAVQLIIVEPLGTCAPAKVVVLLKLFIAVVPAQLSENEGLNSAP